MDLCHLKSSELEQQFQKYIGRVVVRGDVLKDGSGSVRCVRRAGIFSAYKPYPISQAIQIPDAEAAVDKKRGI